MSLQAVGKHDIDSDLAMRASRQSRALALVLSTSAFFFFSCISAHADVPGRTMGYAGVSQSGAATYTIPIDVPPGINGMAPSIALTYSSQSGNGHVGAHWDISGQSSIRPCRRTLAQNGTGVAPTLSGADALCLDGNQLRLVSGSQGEANSQYRAEFDDQALVTLKDGGLQTGGWFEVRERSGRIREYGHGRNSPDQPGVPLSTQTIGWRLSAIKDRTGNAIEYTYAHFGQGEVGRLMSIQYGGNSAAPVPMAYTVVFNYTITGPVYNSGNIGGVAYFSSGLLGSVEVKTTAGQVVRSYQITYNTTGPSGSERYTLNSVKQCASTTAECLPPLTFTWSAGDTSWPSAQTAPSVPAYAPTMVMDFNGDGYDDLVYYSAGWQVMWGSASGYNATTTTGAVGSDSPAMSGWGAYTGQSSGPIDVDGDGRQDLMVPKGGYWWWLRCASDCKATGAFLYTSTGVPVTISELLIENPGSSEPTYTVNVAHLTSADINGDGYPDLVTELNGVVTMNAHASDGSASFAAATSLGSGVTILPVAEASVASSRHYHFDASGEGRDDVFTVAAPKRVSYSHGTSIWPGVEGSYGYLVPAFLNADGCTDFLSNAGAITALCGAPGSYGLSGPTSTGSSRPIPIDWNNDGIEEGYNSDAMIPADATIRISDINGDGMQDVTWISSSGAVNYHLHPGVMPELLTSITDGYGNTTTFNYQPLSAGHCYARDSGAPSGVGNRAVSPAEGPRVVCSLASSDGIGGTYTQSFQYFNANTNNQGRGDLGFEKRTVTDSRNNIVHEERYRYDFPYTGMLAFSSDKQSNGTLIATTTNTLQENVTGSGYQASHAPFVQTSTSDRYEVGGIKDGQKITTSTTAYSYDTYGNALNVMTTVTDVDTASPYANQSWTTATATTYSTDASSNWCLVLPSMTTITNSAPGTPPLTRTVSYPTPALNYVKCRVEQKITEPNSSTYAVTETYGFDAFGNVSSVSTQGASMPARATATDWAPSGRFPMSVTNALNQITYFDYDVMGALALAKDPNNIQTTWQYDSFGRKNRENRPDGTYTIVTYADCATAGCALGSHGLVATSKVYNSQDGLVQTEGTTYFDSLDRPLVNTARNLSGGYDRNEVRYDALGRVQYAYMPCTWSSISTPCSYRATRGYDILGRMVSESRPISASNSASQTTSISYQGRTTVVTDPQNKQTTKITTVAGTLGRSQDHDGYYQSFQYDAFGNPTLVTDSQSNTLMTKTYAYGIGVFPTGMTDMDLGSWGYTPNALGEVTAYTDANSTAFSATYDKLSRPLTRTVPGEGITIWTWGSEAVNHDIGQLQSISSPAGPTETYSYDSKGRLINRKIISDTTYDYDLAYDDNTGKIDTVTYPVSTSGYRLKLKYRHQNGIVDQVKDFNSATVFWQANATNARGQVTQEILGNGLVTNKSFDAVTGWINSIQCAVGGGTCAQNQSYLFDAVGNLTQRQNNNLGLTENFYYDNLYRLTSSQVNGVTNLTMTYDALGNINSKSDVAGGALWTYHATKRHQVTQAGNSNYTYSYDANGNAITRNGFGITWNKDNYPTQINGPSGETTNLFYDGNQQRWKQVYTKSGTTETTIYVGPLQKVSVTGQPDDYRHFISANGQTVAIVSRVSGVNTPRYLLHDALGSVAKITNSSGGDVVSESFTAFGTRRNPLTWSGSATNGDLVTSAAITREGFTGHDALGSLGLNHMNGRVQDAITGRFLSADPYVTEPFNTQGYNRYSYVMNNPLTFTDPSGFAGGYAYGYQGEIIFPPVYARPSPLGPPDPPVPLFQPFAPPADYPPWAPAPHYDLNVKIVVTAKRLQSQGGRNAGAEQTTKCSAPKLLSKDATAVPFTDDRGNPILGEGGAPMMRPAGFDPHFFAAAGARDLARINAKGMRPGTMNVNSLAKFRQGGSWDAQRIGGTFHDQFVDSATVFIGIYASNAGLSQDQILGVQNGYASAFSKFKNGTVFDSKFTALPLRNVQNTQLGYNLVGNGDICTP